jgi:hypothetical protein
MKYSLRRLMIVVTLICVALGGRVAYLRHMVAHHRREAMNNEPHSRQPGNLPVYWFHRTVAERFRDGLYRPWELIDDRSPESAKDREVDPLDPFWE